MLRPRLPLLFAPSSRPQFPDPERADARGLLAAGGALTPEWLLSAYRSGIFPWYDEDTPPLWWSPDPRAVMEPAALHVSRSMRRFLRTTSLRLAYDRCFEGVIRSCAAEREEGTWLLPEMIAAYCELHRLGHAHSVEVWDGDQLVGGLYGVQCGALFAAESMFHRVTNASKVALIAALRALFACGIRLFDVQFETPHLASLGAYCISRREYLRRLRAAVDVDVDLSDTERALALARE